MKKLSPIQALVIAGICTALCAVLPIAFHIFPNGGRVFSPMHIPVLLCGLVCGPALGLISGMLGPVLSMLTTGMPGAAFLPRMMVELAAYGLVAGLMMRFVRTGKLLYDVIISLVAAMLAGRVVAGIASALFFAPGQFAMGAWFASYITGSLPGIAVHLVLIPAVMLALEKAKLIPARYAKA